MTQRHSQRGPSPLTCTGTLKVPSLRSTPSTVQGNKPRLHDFETARQRKCELRRQGKGTSVIDSGPLQRTITAATAFALRSVENYQSRKGFDPDATAPQASASWDSGPWWTDLSDNAATPGRDRTPTKRNVEDFFRSSVRYGEGFTSILGAANESIETTKKPACGLKTGHKSLVLCRRAEALTSKSALAPDKTALTSKAQLVLSSLRSLQK